MTMANAFTETYSRTSYSDTPVTYYILSCSPISALLMWGSHSSTTDFPRFEELVKNHQSETGGMLLIAIVMGGF